MPLLYEADENGRSRVVVRDEPDYIVPLAIAPVGLEPELSRGKWICVSMSVWSGLDTAAGQLAIRQVRQQQGAIQLGLRPFDFPEENHTWIPDIPADRTERFFIDAKETAGATEVMITSDPAASPVWLGISDGKFVRVQYGQLSREEINELIAAVIDFS